MVKGQRQAHNFIDDLDRHISKELLLSDRAEVNLVVSLLIVHNSLKSSFILLKRLLYDPCCHKCRENVVSLFHFHYWWCFGIAEVALFKPGLSWHSVYTKRSFLVLIYTLCKKQIYCKVLPGLWSIRILWLRSSDPGSMFTTLLFTC